MSNKKFWLYNSIGSIFWAVSLTLIGVFFIQNYETILDNIGKITTGFLILFLIYIFIFKKEAVKKYWEDKNREMEEKYNQKNKQL